jgi:hypothetical protein
MTLQEKADAARELLKNSAFKLVMHDTRNAVVAGLEAAGMTDHDTQHEGVLMLQLLKRIETQLQRYVEDWEVEKKRQESKDWIDRTRQRLSRTWR